MDGGSWVTQDWLIISDVLLNVEGAADQGMDR